MCYQVCSHRYLANVDRYGRTYFRKSLHRSYKPPRFPLVAPLQLCIVWPLSPVILMIIPLVYYCCHTFFLVCFCYARMLLFCSCARLLVCSSACLLVCSSARLPVSAAAAAAASASSASRSTRSMEFHDYCDRRKKHRPTGSRVQQMHVPTCSCTLLFKNIIITTRSVVFTLHRTRK